MFVRTAFLRGWRLSPLCARRCSGVIGGFRGGRGGSVGDGLDVEEGVGVEMLSEGSDVSGIHAIRIRSVRFVWVVRVGGLVTSENAGAGDARW